MRATGVTDQYSLPIAKPSVEKRTTMRSTRRERLKRVLLASAVLSAITMTAVATTSSASATPAPAQAGRTLCDYWAEKGIIAADDSMVNWAWAFGHAAGCW